MSHDAHLVLLAGILLAAGVGSSRLASALRLPALLQFLGVGMAVGSDGLGWTSCSSRCWCRPCWGQRSGRWRSDCAPELVT